MNKTTNPSLSFMKTATKEKTTKKLLTFSLFNPPFICSLSAQQILNGFSPTAPLGKNRKHFEKIKKERKQRWDLKEPIA